MSPADVIGGIFSQLGLDLDAKLPNPDGLDLRIAPAAPGGAPEAGPLKEIM